MRQEHHSAPWDLLPDIQARLDVHRAVSFKRSAPCRAFLALQVLPPDIDSRTKCDDASRGRLSWRPLAFSLTFPTARARARRAPGAHQERWPLWHLGSGLLAAVIGVTGLALEARIAADGCTHAICSGDRSTLAASLASAIAGDCRGLISFGVAGGLSPDLPAGTCIVGSMIVSKRSQLTPDRDWSRALLR